MKAANFLNILLATALVLLCAKLHFMQTGTTPTAAPATAQSEATHPEVAPFHGAESPAAASETVTIDSTGLAPGVSGYGGPVPVEVAIRDGIVMRVTPKLPNDETPMFFSRLDEDGLWGKWNGLPVEVAATSRVDAVTGATYSSEAAIANVRAALGVAAAVGNH